jgi:hypothetical protein
MLCVNARSVPAATADTIPISTAFQRVNAAFAPPGGVSTFQTEAPCTLGSHRSETAQAQPRISAFNYLVFPSDKQHQQQIQPYGPPPRFIGPLSRHEARPRNSSPPCPRCLQPRHLRRNCWNKIRCHGCNKPGHAKKDCFLLLRKLGFQRKYICMLRKLWIHPSIWLMTLQWLTQAATLSRTISIQT